ncbi:MAG: tripartite tricarboxylate transporter substrate binding protein [Betaproteobacteria bacterium]|nr:MAG: tripartite tricarboxylate transporter substrate binding protein [Betaproteobacteria bacterium]
MSLFHRLTGCIASAAALVAAAPAIAADNYPSRPVRVIVPQSPSGSTDIATRIVTDRLAEVLKQNFVVDNRPGAGSLTGTDLVAKAAPDGYTLLGIAASFTITPAMHTRMPFDPVRDFAPITQFADLPHIIVVHPSVAAKSVKELIALLKSKPGQVTCAFSGVGTSTHLATELFQYMSGTKMLLVPYKGGSPAMTALLGGEVQVNFAASSTALPQIRAGKIRALAVTGTKRSTAAPDLPTMAEAGVKGYQHSSWVGLLAPAKTPPAIIDRLHAESVKIINSAEVKKLFLGRGMEAEGNTPAAFAASVREDVEKWKKLVKAAGIKAR